VAAPVRAATEVGVEVVNDASPRVEILAPADGARVPAGAPLAVVARSAGGERLWVAIDGRAAWRTTDPTLTGTWTPDAGRHRIVAVAEADGRPDAVAGIGVTADEQAAGTPGVASGPGAAGPGGTPATGAPGHAGAPAGPGSGASSSAAVSPAIAAPGASRTGTGARTAPASGPRRPAPAGAGTVRSPGSAPAPAAAGPDRGSAGEAERRGGWLDAPGAVIAARVAAFPLLLLLAAALYTVLQRFIDGGPKLAWLGRGPAQDTLVEF
jgi:hypothetical protein